MRQIVHSKKHYFQKSLSSVTNGAIINELLIQAKESNATLPEDVEQGAIVKAVYCEFWLQNASTSVGSFVAGVYKQPGTGAVMSAANAIALHDWDNKNNLLYVTQGLSPENDTALMPVIKFWVKIPKGKQRFGLGDKFRFFIRNLNATDDINYCGFAVYKEYS